MSRAFPGILLAATALDLTLIWVVAWATGIPLWASAAIILGVPALILAALFASDQAHHRGRHQADL